MKKLIFGCCLIFLLVDKVWAGQQTVYQHWVTNLAPGINEAYTIADSKTSLGLFCASDQCLFYLHQDLQCSPGKKYSVLINSASISEALTMECTQINGSIFQILTPFNLVLQALQSGEGVGFAVALQSGAFAVARFSVLGAKPAIERVLLEAASAKQKEQMPAKPPANEKSPLIPASNKLTPI